MPYYSDPTLYSVPIPSYSLYLSGPYSTHSSLIASRSVRPNTFVKPLSRFHRGYAPHLSTISENQVNSALRRKYSPHLPLHHGSAKYTVPRPIKINTADIDVSADRYKSRVSPNLENLKTRISDNRKEKAKSPSPSKADDEEELTNKPIRRDRHTVRLHTVHKDEDKSWKNILNSNLSKKKEKASEQNDAVKEKKLINKKEEEPPKENAIQKNASFHDICTAISQENNEELNPGQPDNIKRKQERTFTNEDLFKQIHRDSADILKDEKRDKLDHDAEFTKEEKFDSRGSVKRKKKVARKKTGESLASDDEVKCTLQRRPTKKYKRTSTDCSFVSDTSDSLEREYQETIRDISNVEVEEIKVKPKPLISATVHVEETVQSKPNLKLVVDDVKIEELPRTPPLAPKKFKFNVTVNIEDDACEDAKTKEPPADKNKTNKSKITDDNKGKVHMPKAKDVLLSDVKQNHQRASLGDIYEDIQKVSSATKNTGESGKHKEMNGTDTEKLTGDMKLYTKKDNESTENFWDLIMSQSKYRDDLDNSEEGQDNMVNGREVMTNHIKKSDTPIEDKVLPTSKGIIEQDQIILEKPRQEDKISTALDKNATLANKIENVPKSPKDQLNENIQKKPVVMPKKDDQDIKKTKPSVDVSKDTKSIAKINKKEQPKSPENSYTLPTKEDNASTDFWGLIGSRESVYVHPTNFLKRNAICVDDSNGNFESLMADKIVTEKNKVNEDDKVDGNIELNSKEKIVLKNNDEVLEIRKEEIIPKKIVPKGEDKVSEKNELNKRILAKDVDKNEKNIEQNTNETKVIPKKVVPNDNELQKNEVNQEILTKDLDEGGKSKPMPKGNDAELKNNEINQKIFTKKLDESNKNKEQNKDILKETVPKTNEEVMEKNDHKINANKLDSITKDNEQNKQKDTNKLDVFDKDIKDIKENEQEEAVPKKIVSKGSLINKPTANDPDLEVFIAPPEPEPAKEPESPKETFTPLMSNRFSKWMHPFKKPEQLDECPIEIYATPKAIRKRHYPRPRIAQPPPPQPKGSDSSDSKSEEESSEDETDTSAKETSSGDEGNVGKSTSSNDSGFNSSNGSPAMHWNKDCDVNIHRKCEKLTANLCGVNQKLIVEAIESVKKGSSDTRDSPTSNPAHNPAFALDPGDTLEEFYTSSTYVGFQKSGRITPPATTIPRFRKYSIEDFNFLKVLGKGSFGKVLLAELKDTEYYYAIKCLKKDVVLEDDDVECTLIERKVLALGTKHPYLCHLLCTFQTESHLFFVMEYLNGGDLMFHIQTSGRFPEPRARVYAAEIVSGLKFLHNKGIVYRDLKLDNILLDFDGHVRIADFGMCKLQIFLDRTADTFCGTPDYMAPEIIKGLHYNQCVDWWSFGVLLYEMVIGQSPFSGCDEDELFWSICNEKPVFPRFLSTEASSILKQLLEKDGNKRLGNKMSPHGDIQDHAFFRPISWDLLERRQLEAPFKPNLQHPLDTQYFDRTFTVEKAKLTPIDKNILQSMDQTQFQGFSYTNPNATDR